MNNDVAMLVELDYCVGCYACQSACQSENGLPVTETYLRCMLGKPERVDGIMTSFMCPVPYRLDKCAECIAAEGGEAPCSKICIGAALHFGTYEQIKEAKEKAQGHVAVFA
ncbi:MAG: hypothetical protein ACOYIK_06940 [Coriobacteriales bacterium]|jgi:Fe-S-cluster-containing dehydrogenase component